jgi:hypothetical protein
VFLLAGMMIAISIGMKARKYITCKKCKIRLYSYKPISSLSDLTKNSEDNKIRDYKIIFKQPNKGIYFSGHFCIPCHDKIINDT